MRNPRLTLAVVVVSMDLAACTTPRALSWAQFRSLAAADETSISANSKEGTVTALDGESYSVTPWTPTYLTYPESRFEGGRLLVKPFEFTVARTSSTTATLAYHGETIEFPLRNTTFEIHPIDPGSTVAAVLLSVVGIFALLLGSFVVVAANFSE